MATSFTVPEKFGDAVYSLNEVDRKELLYSVCTYGMYGEVREPPHHLRALFSLMKADMDESREEEG